MKANRKFVTVAIALNLLGPSVVQAQETTHADHAHFHEHLRKSGLSANEIEKLLPTEPAQALTFLFEKMNAAEQTDDEYTSTRYKFEIADSLPAGELYKVETELSSGTELTMKVTIRKDLANNPFIALEALTQMNSALVRDGSNFNVFSKASSKYIESEYAKDEHGKYKIDQHGLLVVLSHKHVTYHYETHIAVLEWLGITTHGNQHDGVSPNAAADPISFMELSINAKNGSALAERELAEIYLNNLRIARQSAPKFTLLSRVIDPQAKLNFVLQAAQARGLKIDANASLDDATKVYFDGVMTAAQEKLTQKTAAAREDLRKRNQAAEDVNLKAKKDELEKLPQKLEDFVKANDRENVAKLLEAFLPWAEMEPMERWLWKDWVAAIRNPNPNPNDSLILFRGVDAQDNVQVSRDASGAEIGYGFFSTLLTKNQGNYTRRLRSVSTMRPKLGTPNGSSQKRSPLEVTPKVSTMMASHSGTPIGSPFMSFSTSAELAHQFSEPGGGMIIAKVDKRRVLPNVVSIIKSEVEMLVPLILFPDEVIHFERIPKGGSDGEDSSVSLEKIIANASTKLGAPIPLKTITAGKDVYRGAYQVFGRAQQRLKQSN